MTARSSVADALGTLLGVGTVAGVRADRTDGEAP
ncbi:MAG: hypothetical protein JWN54_1310 [Mycobacterium sp.]|jgi:hypothetical protein|nr:hypothetical protein [Mycobacterium sp.]